MLFHNESLDSHSQVEYIDVLVTLEWPTTQKQHLYNVNLSDVFKVYWLVANF